MLLLFCAIYKDPFNDLYKIDKKYQTAILHRRDSETKHRVNIEYFATEIVLFDDVPVEFSFAIYPFKSYELLLKYLITQDCIIISGCHERYFDCLHNILAESLSNKSFPIFMLVLTLKVLLKWNVLQECLLLFWADAKVISVCKHLCVWNS